MWWILPITPILILNSPTHSYPHPSRSDCWSLDPNTSSLSISAMASTHSITLAISLSSFPLFFSFLVRSVERKAHLIPTCKVYAVASTIHLQSDALQHAVSFCIHCKSICLQLFYAHNFLFLLLIIWSGGVMWWNMFEIGMFRWPTMWDPWLPTIQSQDSNLDDHAWRSAGKGPQCFAVRRRAKFYDQREIWAQSSVICVLENSQWNRTPPWRGGSIDRYHR